MLRQFQLPAGPTTARPDSTSRVAKPGRLIVWFLGRAMEVRPLPNNLQVPFNESLYRVPISPSEGLISDAADLKCRNKNYPHQSGGVGGRLE